MFDLVDRYATDPAKAAAAVDGYIEDIAAALSTLNAAKLEL